MISRITELKSYEAKQFFLMDDSYFKLRLPSYLNFEHTLNEINYLIGGRKTPDLFREINRFNNDPKYHEYDDPRYHENVSFEFYCNKSGIYSWRPYQLINPFLYVKLVSEITKPDNWEHLTERVKEFESQNIECFSIPFVEYERGFACKGFDETSENPDIIKGSLKPINNYPYFEKKSIEMSLDYDYLFKTDIQNFYSSIYTHALSWAIHGKEDAFKHKDDNEYLGVSVDLLTRMMQNNTSNGIPQGSVLMDFLSEILLGYVDKILFQRIVQDKSRKIKFKILRYRDDYRIFVNSANDGERIFKYLVEVLRSVGLRINGSKTTQTEKIIRNSIKEYKVQYIEATKENLEFSMTNNHFGTDQIYEFALRIYSLSEKYPNSHYLKKLLSLMYDKLARKLRESYDMYFLFEVPDWIAVVSVITDLLIRNPITTPDCIAVLSILFEFDIQEGAFDKKEKEEFAKKIHKKFKHIPNSGYFEIWFQRFTIKQKFNIQFENPLCKAVNGEETEIWNNTWLKEEFRKGLQFKKILMREKINQLEPIIDKDEIRDVYTY